MDAKPGVLFLIVLAGLGTAILSPLNVNGIPILVLVIPFSILAAILYNVETGLVVGAGSAGVSGLLVHSLGGWEVVGYSLAAAITLLAYDAVYPKQKKDISAILFAVLGTLIYELIHEFSLRETILFRSELFLGTQPVLGLQIAANVFAMGILLSYYRTEK